MCLSWGFSIFSSYLSHHFSAICVYIDAKRSRKIGADVLYEQILIRKTYPDEQVRICLCIKIIIRLKLIFPIQARKV